MKINLKLAALISFALFSESAFSSECGQSLSEKLNLLAPDTYQLFKKKPQQELKAVMDVYEITCPWHVNQDFDGDKKRDYLGLVNKKGKYHLVGYFSNGGKSKVIELKSFERFPEESHFSYITLKEFKLFAKKPEKVSRTLRYGLVENRLNKSSQVFQWNGKTMVQIGSFPGQF